MWTGAGILLCPFLCPCAHFKKPFKGILRSKKPLHCATSCGKCNEIIISLSCRLTRIRVCDIEILHDLAQIHGSRGWLYFSVKVFENSTTVGKFGKLIASARSCSRYIANNYNRVRFECQQTAFEVGLREESNTQRVNRKWDLVNCARSCGKQNAVRRCCTGEWQ